MRAARRRDLRLALVLAAALWAGVIALAIFLQ